MAQLEATCCVPTVVFVIAYLVSGSNLTGAVVAALAAGFVIVVWRAIRHEPLQQVFAGFAGVAISAAFAKYTGKAENYFLPGFLQNLGYGLAFLISIIVRWPLLGVAMGYLTGEGTAWRKDPVLRRTYAAASWIWVGLFFGRLAVQVPLYFAGALGALVYALHCPEMATPFLAVWYVAGMAIPTALGAVLGPRLLRW